MLNTPPSLQAQLMLQSDIDVPSAPSRRKTSSPCHPRSFPPFATAGRWGIHGRTMQWLDGARCEQDAIRCRLPHVRGQIRDKRDEHSALTSRSTTKRQRGVLHLLGWVLPSLGIKAISALASPHLTSTGTDLTCMALGRLQDLGEGYMTALTLLSRRKQNTH